MLKWQQSSVKIAYNFGIMFQTGGSIHTTNKIKSVSMELDEIRITLGPYLVGIFLAICALSLENYFHNKLESSKVVLKNVIKRRGRINRIINYH